MYATQSWVCMALRSLKSLVQEDPRATHLWRALSVLLSPGLARLGSLPVDSSTSASPPRATEAATAAAKAVDGEWRERDLHVSKVVLCQKPSSSAFHP